VTSIIEVARQFNRLAGRRNNQTASNQLSGDKQKSKKDNLPFKSLSLGEKFRKIPIPTRKQSRNSITVAERDQQPADPQSSIPK